MRRIIKRAREQQYPGRQDDLLRDLCESFATFAVELLTAESAKGRGGR